MPRGRLVARAVNIDALSRDRIDDMWRLFDLHYVDVCRDTFERDLQSKDEVILLLDGDTLGGFSTLQVLEGRVGGKPYAAVYSGDTVIHGDYWGQTALQRAFFLKLVATRLRYLDRPVYWFLISKGYKTYLLLTRNFANAWPRRSETMPPTQRAVMAQLAERKFQEAWKPASGLLVFDRPMGRLRAGVASPEGVDDPDVQFFQARNPNHAQGEELVCLGQVNLALARRFIGKQLARLLRSQASPARSRSRSTSSFQ